jgi:putative transcriptional regulator
MAVADWMSNFRSKIFMKNNIKVQRAIHNLTQEELANKIGVSRQTVNAIEADKYLPSLGLAFKIARLFKLKVEEVFIYEEVKHENDN